MATATLQIAGDSEKAQSAIVALEKRLDKLQGQLKAVSRKTKDTGRDGAKSFGSVFSQGVDKGIVKLGAMAAGWVGVSQAISIASNELRAYMELKKSQGREQVSFSTSFDSALLNMGAGATPEALQKIIAQVNQKTGVRPDAIANALSDAFSARGDLSIERAVETVSTALGIAKNIPDLQAPLTGAALDLQKLSPNADAQDAIGLLLATGGQSRVVDPRMLAENIAPGINQVVSAGASPQEAASLLSALSQSINDVRGSVTATAGVALSRQMSDFFGNKDYSKNLSALQSDDKLRSDFLANSSFELKAKTAVENLLSPGGQTAGLYTNAMANIPVLENAQGVFQSQLAALSSGQANQAGGLSQYLDAASSNLLLTDDGKVGVILDKLDGLLANSGLGYLNRTAVTASIATEQLFRGSGLGAAESAVATRLEDIAGKQAAGRFNTLPEDVRELSPAEQEQARILKETLEVIRGVRNSLNSIDQKTEKPQKTLKRNE